MTLRNLTDKETGEEVGLYNVSIDDLLWADQTVDLNMDVNMFYNLACEYLEKHYHKVDINTDYAKIDEIYYA